MTLKLQVIITFTFCCDNLCKSKCMALEKPGKLREFFSPTLWPHRRSCPTSGRISEVEPLMVAAAVFY